MYETRGNLTRCVGCVGLFLTLLWCAAGAGIYGSAIGCFHGADLNFLILVLLFGPVSILPAGVVANWKPRLAGGLLLSSSLLTFLLLLGWASRGHSGIQLREFAGVLVRAMALITLLCGPQFLLGAAFLWEDRQRLRALACSKRGAAIGAGLLTGIVAAVITIRIANHPEWTLMETWEGGGRRSLRFDPTNSSANYREIDAFFDPLFETPIRPGREGRYTVSGRRADGTPFSTSYSVVAERKPNGRLLFHCNGGAVGQELRDDKAIADARHLIVEGILNRAAKDWQSAPSQRAF